MCIYIYVYLYLLCVKWSWKINILSYLILLLDLLQFVLQLLLAGAPNDATVLCQRSHKGKVGLLLSRAVTCHKVTSHKTQGSCGLSSH